MTDGFGRTIDYLRISVTDRCNLRCLYCMPKDGIPFYPHSEILSFEEITRFTRIMADSGIKKIRLTGGEALVRKDIEKLVYMLSEIPQIESLNMTTNALLLSDYSARLKSAGLKSVNVSLDTINPEHFKELSGGGQLSSVLRGIDSALEQGLQVKINCVPVMGHNEDDIIALCHFASEKKIDIRFIELMPIGKAVSCQGLSFKKLYENLQKSFGSEEKSEKIPEEEENHTIYYKFQKMNSRVGFIQPLTASFCHKCNRIRLTADGFLKLCLHQKNGINVKSLLRGNKSDEEIKIAVQAAVDKKPASHTFLDAENARNSEKRIMAQIGG